MSSFGFILFTAVFLLLWLWMFTGMIYHNIQILKIRKKATSVSSLSNDRIDLVGLERLSGKCRIYMGINTPFFAEVLDNGAAIIFHWEWENILLMVPREVILSVSLRQTRFVPLSRLIIVEHTKSTLPSPIIIEPYRSAFQRGYTENICRSLQGEVCKGRVHTRMPVSH